MDNDYQNFVERMGSFDDVMDMSDDSEILQSNTRIVTRNRSALTNKDDELMHYGKLGMRWGRRGSSSSISSNKNVKKQAHKLKKDDAEWEKGINNQTKSKSLINKIQKDPNHQKEVGEVISKLKKSGLTGKPLEEAAHYAVMEKINNRLLKDPEAYNPSKTKVMMMMNVATPFGTMAKPMAIEVNRIEDPPKLKHSEISDDDFIMHYGKLGMRWGHKSHVDAKWTSSDGSSHTPFKVSGNMVGKAAKTGQDLTSLGQTVNKVKFSKKSLAEAKNLNDDDLKRLTTRLNLENNYMNAQMQQSGRGKVENILSTAGSALAVASSAAILYEAVKKFK